MGFRISAAALAACIAASSASADVTISSHATKNMSCSAGLCAPTAATAFLNAGDLQTMLASSSVTVKSNAAAPDIHVALALSWASSNTLTLDSYRAIGIERPVSVTGTGGLTITTDDGGTGGDYAFTATGHAIFWDTSSSLTIDAQSYTLVASIAAMASGYAGAPSGNFALANDYDAAPDGTYTQSPIAGTVSGNFEGLGNTISHLSIRYHGTAQQNIGLFSTVTGSTIRDLNLRHAKVRAFPLRRGIAQMGTLVGQMFGTVLNDTAVGTVTLTPTLTASGQAGGLVGFQEGASIVNSSFAGTVSTGNAVAGGLVAQAMTTLITRSSSTATVNSTTEQGGLVGMAAYSTFVLDHATGNLTGGGNFANGGLVGQITNTQVSQCYATGSVVGGPGAYTGGLVGWSEEHSAVAESYALGAVSGQKNSNVGGLIGNSHRFNLSPSVAQAYSTGAVSATGGGPHFLVGGLMGFDGAMDVQSAYWDLHTSGISNPSQGAGSPANDPGITGLSDVALKSGLPSGFDPGIWGSNPSINGGLPYLLALPPG